MWGMGGEVGENGGEWGAAGACSVLHLAGCSGDKCGEWGGYSAGMCVGNKESGKCDIPLSLPPSPYAPCSSFLRVSSLLR